MTRNDGGLPPPCDLEGVGGQVLDFLQAFADDDPDNLARFFGSADFQWYSVGDASSSGATAQVTAYTVPGVMAYAMRRRANHERLELLAMDAGPGRFGAAIGYTLLRQADDLPSQQMMLGKGEVNCRERTVPVWSMSVEPALDRESPGVNSGDCPPPPPDALVGGSIAIVCTRKDARASRLASGQ